MQGGMIVVGLTTGGHLIEDIQTHVPHKIAVFIPVDRMLRSKDLYRGLSQNLLFKLDGGTGFPAEESTVPNDSLLRITQLEIENRGLQQELATAKAQNVLLQGLLQGLQGQMTALHQGITRLEQKEPTTVITVAAGAAVSSVMSEVGTEAPIFLPGEIKPKDAETQIQVERQVSEGSSVGAAGDKLRELRRKANG